MSEANNGGFDTDKVVGKVAKFFMPFMITAVFGMLTWALNNISDLHNDLHAMETRLEFFERDFNLLSERDKNFYTVQQAYTDKQLLMKEIQILNMQVENLHNLIEKQNQRIDEVMAKQFKPTIAASPQEVIRD